MRLTRPGTVMMYCAGTANDSTKFSINLEYLKIKIKTKYKNWGIREFF